VLAHPSSVLLLAGLGVWLTVTYAKRDRLSRLWSKRKVRWGVLLGTVLVVAVAFRVVPLLYGWISIHDTGRVKTNFCCTSRAGKV
jgi:hypothetical protein